VILAYHNILPDGQRAFGDRSLHLPRKLFAQQLDRLSETHEVVGLDELLRARPDSGRLRAIITFDDAYRGTLEYGLPELSRRGMAATVFVAPALLGDRAFWWDLLALPTTGEVPARLRDRALRTLDGRHDAVLQALSSDAAGVDQVPSHSRSATETELQAAVGEHELSLGSHTWSHPNLTELDDAEVSGELTRSWEWLTARFTAVVPWLAYPYGLTSERVAGLAGGVFDGALSLAGRVAPPSVQGAARYDVPRINIPAGLSLNAFELRVSGIVRR
jgi:peptidoglycan/xylan/chitin deacetylase (PgdA/CDA1 family)